MKRAFCLTTNRCMLRPSREDVAVSSRNTALLSRKEASNVFCSFPLVAVENRIDPYSAREEPLLLGLRDGFEILTDVHPRRNEESESPERGVPPRLEMEKA